MNTPTVIEYKDIRVLTTEQLAQVYETGTRRISENFNENKEHYTENKHYYLLQSEELKAFKREYGISVVAENANKFYLWTEIGALLHAKSLNTDKAWEVYTILVDTYFKAKEQQQIDSSKLSPELQLFKQMFDTVAKQQIKTQEIEEKQEQQQSELDILKGKIDIINDSEFAIVGYCNLHNIPIDNKSANFLGRKATKLSKQKGYRIGRVTHPMYGEVNTYHTDILDIVIDEWQGFGY